MKNNRVVLLGFLSFILSSFTFSDAKASKEDGFTYGLRKIKEHARSGRSWSVVSDMDNTLVDVRPRTQAAWQQWVDLKVAMGNKDLAKLRNIPLGKIKWDGRQTAENMGLSKELADDFHAHWDTYFWDAKNWKDPAIVQSLRLVKEAIRFGGKVVILTGRNDGEGTAAQLRGLGIDPTTVEIMAKPPGVKTDEFKFSVLNRLAKRPKHEIAFYLEDSSSTILKVEENTRLLNVKSIYYGKLKSKPDPEGKLKPMGKVGSIPRFRLKSMAVPVIQIQALVAPVSAPETNKDWPVIKRDSRLRNFVNEVRYRKFQLTNRPPVAKSKP